MKIIFYKVKYFFCKFIYLYLIIIIFLLDYVSKYLIILKFRPGDSIKITFFMNFLYSQNFGLAFSFLAKNHAWWQRWIISFISIIIIIILFIMIFNLDNRSYFNKIAYSIIIGGAIGNLLDRILYGFVIDFIDLNVKNWHWPTFNIADLAISIGIIIILLNSDEKVFNKNY